MVIFDDDGTKTVDVREKCLVSGTVETDVSNYACKHAPSLRIFRFIMLEKYFLRKLFEFVRLAQRNSKTSPPPSGPTRGARLCLPVVPS